METKQMAMIVGAGALLLVAGVVLVSPDDPEDPEVQIKAALDRTAEAASNKDLDGVLEIISDDFKGPSAASKRDVKRIVFAQIRTGAWNRVFFVSTSIDVKDDQETAEVSTGAVLARGKDVQKITDVAPRSADTFRFDLSFKKEGDDWRIVSGQYKRANLSDILPGT